MSGYAYQWAKRQRVGDSSTKTLLKTYAHWAAEDYSTWVSNDELLADTELDIKTVRKCRDKLIALGFLVETKRRMGKTGSIIVYQLLAPEGSVVVQQLDQQTRETLMLSPPSLKEYEAKQNQKRSSSKSGAPKGDQKRSPSESGAAPDLPGSPSTFTSKPLQISPEAPPNLDPKSRVGLQELGRESDARAEHTPNSLPPDEENQKAEPTAARIHPDWKPTEEQIAQALLDQPGWDAAEVARQARKFRNYWLAKPGNAALRVDWSATWENWVLSHDPAKDRTAPAAGDAPPATDGAWYEGTPEVIEARGVAFGVRPRKPNEPIAMYRVLVVKASRDKAAIDFVLRDARRFNSQQLFEFAVATFGDELLPPDFYAS
ncbi:hypothetical protein G3N58_15195 [Paraburkholderia sp. Ac-20342]|uniref:hypothetical protein n=1 Tax=Paraburkholderia sp. Ac-20342 TaxID=2703889 RepID=UPI001982358A|nr:hypothetical protein [Paraburkholderia sp. Ac-20342]MBN3848166.1 hypothetical protein [Paraburkholderia sp. Ac-20342]